MPVRVRWRHRPSNCARIRFHAAITALVESGVEPNAITSLADLVSPENFKRILRRRHETVAGRENAFNRDIARCLVQIARRVGKG